MSSADRNRDYYDTPSAAREDYWRYMAAPRARVARIVQLLRRLHAPSIADLGCGNGRLLEKIAHALPSARLAGLDLSRRQIEENRRRTPRVEWVTADLQEAIEPRATFAAVVASEVIEHLDEPQMLLRNALTLAAAGGHLILTTQSGQVRETERHVGHVRHFTADEMRTLLLATGWTPLRVWNEGFPFHDLSKWWANRDAEGSLQRFGGEAPYPASARLICAALRVAFRLNSRTRGAQLYALARKEA